MCGTRPGASIPIIAFLAFVVCLTGCERPGTAKEELKAGIRRVTEEGWNKGNVDVLDDHYATDVVLRRSPYPDVEGLEGLKKLIAGFRSSFPDLQITIEEIIVEGETSAARYTFRGTHKEQGKQVVFPGCVVSRRVDGKTVEEWFIWDDLGLHQQLGSVLTPAGGQGKESQQ